jgi:hypothetical protein
VLFWTGATGASPTPPFQMTTGMSSSRTWKRSNNPGGTPIEAFDQIRAAVVADRSQFWKDLSLPLEVSPRIGHIDPGRRHTVDRPESTRIREYPAARALAGPARKAPALRLA